MLFRSTNSTSYTDTRIGTVNSAITANASAAYTNATTYSSNASNITSGTLAEPRLPYRMDQNVRTTDTVTLGNLTLTGTVNSTSYTVGTSTVANSTGVYTGVVNAASHTVGTSTIANSTGVYTGVVNGSSHTVGTSFTANSTLVNAYAIVTQTNTVTIGTGSYFVANGNVGIGTSSPAASLDIGSKTDALEIGRAHV